MLTLRSVEARGLLLFPVLASFILLSCADRIKTSIIVYKALDESLSNSNATIKLMTEGFIWELENKTFSQATMEKAKIWLPKARMLDSISNNHIKYIEHLKVDLMREAGADMGESEIKFKENDKGPVI